MDSRLPGCVKTPSRPHVLDECCQNREIWIRKIRAVLLPDSNVPNVVPIREFSHSLFRGNDGSRKSATIAPYAITLPRRGAGLPTGRWATNGGAGASRRPAAARARSRGEGEEG